MVITKREKIFGLICLSIINVLCLVKFLIDLIDGWKSMDLLVQTMNEYGHDTSAIASVFDSAKIIFTMSLCLTVILFVLSIIFFCLKNKNAKSAMFIICIAIVFSIVVFYFINLFTNRGTVNYLQDDFYYLSLIMNAINSAGPCLIISSVASLFNAWIICNLSKENIKQEVSKVEENKEDPVESALSEEIAKLKAKIRIKNLEKEYLNLKLQIDEDNELNDNKKT